MSCFDRQKVETGTKHFLVKDNGTAKPLIRPPVQLVVEPPSDYSLRLFFCPSPNRVAFIAINAVLFYLACVYQSSRQDFRRKWFFEENNESSRVLNFDEERLYLMAASQPLQDYATILIETGLRPSELCNLAVADVNMKCPQPYLTVLKGKTKSSSRTVPLSKRASAVLSRRIATAEGKYIFAGGRGGKSPDLPAVKFNNAHSGALTRSKIDGEGRSGTAGKCTLYSFRHTFATRFIESGGDLLTLAALLGHSSLRMVMRYAHPSDTHKFDAIQRMDEKRALAAKKAA